MMTRWITAIAVLFIILIMMLPKRDEASLAKIASASMLMCTKDFREAVASQLLKGEPLSVPFKNGCPELIAALQMDEQGAMVISGKKYQLKLLLSPVVENNGVRWSCRGEPAEAVSKLCQV